MSNPLLHEMLARDDLPRYDLIQPAQVAAAVDTLLAEARATLARVTAPANAISWATVMEPLTDATERLGRAWGAVHHMSGVMDSPEWREAINSRLAEVTAFWTELAQHPDLFRASKALEEQFKNAPPTPQDSTSRARFRALQNSLRAFRLGGAELPEDKKKVFAELQARLARLTQKFSASAFNRIGCGRGPTTRAHRLGFYIATSQRRPGPSIRAGSKPTRSHLSQAGRAGL
jgi:oligopeptidase A